MSIKTLAANMRSAFIDGKSAKIGGGIFTPEELKDGAIALNAFPDLLYIASWIEKECEEGDGTIPDGLYNAARAAIKKATGG